jgi:hypothetical protein
MAIGEPLAPAGDLLLRYASHVLGIGARQRRTQYGVLLRTGSMPHPDSTIPPRDELRLIIELGLDGILQQRPWRHAVTARLHRGDAA